ncbi:Xaa-Pro peptidase family protein [Rhodocaloribacter litoris]|uniref:M24 family metallopeptidase n=1 Tax=Rhodocaloribacter litoris TaxID=2558931 RepID=UPI001422567A|nr:Xaa-Pro peptidase family protein [Rhodocaloribacter litoris]QXD15510.1 Xaa-Pro peptidase family protein [Rhodocaloribacter litoris]
MPTRLDRIRALCARQEAGAALITSLPDVRWACGFTGSNGVLIVRPGAAHLITDGRYRVQAEREVRDAAVHAPGYDLLGYAAEAGLFEAGEKVLLQAEHVTLAGQARLRALFPDVAWHPVEQLLVRLVAEKAPEEVACIRRAQRLTEAVFSELLDLLRPGMTEREVAAEIVYRHLRHGAERMAFEPIVAAGPNGALPHARPTHRKIETGDLVVLDFGGVVDGYASDLTRTVAVGEPGEEARRVYDVVRAAQRQALAAARAGIIARELDAAARDVIAAAGYAEYFPHSLGHGIGLQTHEWPAVSFRSEEALPAGAAVTIEPGIYLPGRFGVRIEDIVVLHDGGCENLTTAPKELIVL